jgi:hypothetical protein
MLFLRGLFEMATDNTQLAVQVHLAEFSALRQEILDVLKWRDGLIFFSLGISGALFSFAFSADPKILVAPSFRHAALYLVPPLSAVVGGLWLSNAWRTYRIGVYIRDVIAPRLNTLISPPDSGRPADFEVLGWESSGQRILGEWQRRLLDLGILLGVFVFAGIAAQYIIISQQPGGLAIRLREVEYPLWYKLNCLIVVVSLALFCLYYWAGRMHVSFSRLRR